VLVPTTVTTMVATNPAGAAEAVPQPDSGQQTRASAPMQSKVVLRVRRDVRAKRIAVARGRVWPHTSNRRVTVRFDGRKVRTVRVTDSGRFRVRWRVGGSGVYYARAVAHRTGTATRDRSGKKRINVFRPALASYYGPGFYGNTTACGKTLTPDMLGVANKSLPCGTRVTLRHAGRTVTVRVIDRGPYSGAREYDLTEATKRKLRFGSTGTVLTTK
jgi:rare lipoprotein A